MTPGAPRSDRLDGLGWAALGVVTVVLSARMDRLASQGVPPFAAPGLLPGLLGLMLVLSGSLLALRSPRAAEPQEPIRWPRLLATLALCLVFSLGLIGHGLPFWLAAALFVASAILVLQAPQRRQAGRGLDARALATAATIGLGAGAVATVVFQYIFLVQLP